MRKVVIALFRLLQASFSWYVNRFAWLFLLPEPYLRGCGSGAEPHGLSDVHVERAGSAGVVHHPPLLGVGRVGHQRTQPHLPVAAPQQGGCFIPPAHACAVCCLYVTGVGGAIFGGCMFHVAPVLFVAGILKTCFAAPQEGRGLVSARPRRGDVLFVACVVVGVVV